MKRRKYPIHPDFKRLANTNPPLNRPSIACMQALEGFFHRAQKSTKEVKVSRITIPLKEGKTMRALFFEPISAKENSPCLVLYHGGGFVLPAAPYHYALAREYAIKSGCKVLFPQYRLAPKYKFPNSLYDCFNAYLYACNNAKALGIDEKKIAVGGDSAGGNLAAAVCLLAKEKEAQMPCGQLLLYPALSFDLQTESMQKYTDTPMCNARDVVRFGKLYLPEGIEKQPYIEPTLASSFSLLPPAYIETAEFDCLHDGGILYAEKLKAEDVAVVLLETKGTIHAFDMVLDSEITRGCIISRVEFLKKIFE
jgi:acetyl esterase/lipase